MEAITTKMKVLVLGGNGFIGSQVITSLITRADVVVGTRQQSDESNQLTIRMQEMLKVQDWKPIVQKYDVIVNSVGILREHKGESYAAVHTSAVAALAKACARYGVRLIHVSAIGLTDKAQSQFIQSKFAGEQAIIDSGAKATIVRPSLLDGEGGYGAKWFRRVAKWPIQFVMQTDGLVAPLQVADLGKAIAKLVVMSQREQPQFVELGGSKAYSIPEYLTLLRSVNGKTKALQIAIPKVLVRLVSHIFDVFAWTPLSFGHYELMQGFNVPNVNLLPRLLGSKPSDLGQADEIGAGEVVILRK